jgi:hypothetical protein
VVTGNPFVVAADYRQAMIGDLIKTRNGWAVQAPTECQNGHPVGAGKVLVGRTVCDRQS